MVLITIVTGAYKPTYNWGASHCRYTWNLRRHHMYWMRSGHLQQVGCERLDLSGLYGHRPFGLPGIAGTGGQPVLPGLLF